MAVEAHHWKWRPGRHRSAERSEAKSGLSPLYTAALGRNRQAIDFLLEHGAIADIFACAILGKATDAEILLKRNPDLARATTPDGMTALHYAARSGHRDVVEILLRYHSDVNARDNRGRTALLEACHGGPWKIEPAEDVIQLLLDHNAQVDLIQAAATGRTDLIASILDRDGGVIDSLDAEGKNRAVPRRAEQPVGRGEATGRAWGRCESV